MLDRNWTKALIEAARIQLWRGDDCVTMTPQSLLTAAGLRGPTSEAERLMLLGIVADLRQKAVEQQMPSARSLADVVAYVRANSRDSRLSRARTARALGLSDSWIAHHFKQQIGVTFARFVTGMRLTDGTDLLSTTDMSLKEVALTFGFRDSGSFSRVFKARYGTTPTQWRWTQLTQHGAPSTEHRAQSTERR